MQVPVLIEQVENNGYRASSGAPLTLSADGATEKEALAKLEQQFRARMKAGSQIVALDISGSPHLLAEFAGMFKDDPLFEQVIEIMAENRRRRNADPDVP